MKGRGGGIRARKPIEIEVKDIYWQKVTFPCEIIPILCRFQRVVALPPFCFTVKASQGFEWEVGRNRERGEGIIIVVISVSLSALQPVEEKNGREGRRREWRCCV